MPIDGSLISSSVQNTLISYLDAGGNLFLSGQGVASYMNGGQFLEGHVYARYVQINFGAAGVTGVPGTAVGDGLDFEIAGRDGADNQSSPDEIAALGPAIPVVAYDQAESSSTSFPASPEAEGSPSSGTAGLMVDTGTYRLVFFAFGFEGIASPEDRERVMSRVMAWLGAYRCDGLAATIVGTEGDDIIDGTAGDDVVVALGGNDTIRTRRGHDVVCAGAGDDLVIGGSGKDLLFGGRGADDLRGGPGHDRLLGGQGVDVLRGS